MNSNKKEKRVHPLGISGTIIYIIFTLIFILGAFLCFLHYFDNIELQKAVDRGIIVDAEIAYLDYSARSSHGGGGINVIMCRYMDENGIIYEGACGSGNMADPEQEQKDRSRIGEKVKVYLGNVTSYGKGHCWAVSYGEDVRAWTALIGAIVFLVLILTLHVLLIIYLLFFYDKLPFKKREKTNN